MKERLLLMLSAWTCFNLATTLPALGVEVTANGTYIDNVTGVEGTWQGHFLAGPRLEGTLTLSAADGSYTTSEAEGSIQQDQPVFTFTSERRTTAPTIPQETSIR